MTQRHKHETVRLTVDFPVEQHTYIKMMAAKEGDGSLIRLKPISQPAWQKQELSHV